MTSPTNADVRLQAARIIALAAALDVEVLAVARALSDCKLRIQADQIGAPGRVTELLAPTAAVLPVSSNRKRARG